jgi:hypothetical protein
MNFKVTRTTGDIGNIGEVLIEDWKNDLQWQGKIVESRSTP